MKKHAIIVLADGFEEIEAITPIDLLRRAEIQVTMLGLNSLEIRGSHDIIVKAAMLFNDFSAHFDALVLPGGPGHRQLLGSDKLLEMIRVSYSRQILCAAICAAPLVFAKAGILNGKKATCFPGDEGNLAGAIFVEKETVVDGNIITGRGAGTSVAFALEIVAYLAGRDKANFIAEKIVYDSK